MPEHGATPASGARARRRRPTLTQLVFALLAVAIVVSVLLTPAAAPDRGSLTSYSAEAGGSRALADALARLGWTVERRSVPYTGEVDTAAVHLVLDPPATVTAGEAHRLLEAVRAGAGLMLVVQPGSALADSLGLVRSEQGATMDLAPAALCPDSLNEQGLIRWPDGRVASWWLAAHPSAGSVAFANVRPGTAARARERARLLRDSVAPAAAPETSRTTSRAAGGTVAERVAASARDDKGEGASGAKDSGGATRDSLAVRAPAPAVLGFPLGRGRVVAVADADLLRNDVLRVCRWDAGFVAVRALEWLAESGGRRALFDEYHHGHGTHADPVGAVRRALVGTAPGRATLVLVAAALVLLVAHAVRVIRPVPRPVEERRSPLEHVDALARAYGGVGATRLAARRMVRGLRRRHARAGVRGADDVEWLRGVAARHPDLAGDVAVLERATAGRIPHDELAAVGLAVRSLDNRLTPPR